MSVVETLREKTRNVITSMLKEKTGTSILDSGDAYGRNWERNQFRDFDQEPHAWLSFKHRYIDFTYNIYHWLLQHLTYHEELDQNFQEFCKGRPDTYYLEDMAAWPEYLLEQSADSDSEATIEPLYFASQIPVIENSYNGESLLSQVIQWAGFQLDCTEIIVLQVHNGCDVRGGYTRPRVFEAKEGADYICITADGHIQCADDPRHSWSTDDAYHWYYQGTAGYGAGKRLEEYDMIDDATLDVEDFQHWRQLNLETLPNIPDAQLPLDPTVDIPDRGYFRGLIEDIQEDNENARVLYAVDRGKLWVDSEGNGYCPICGGRLMPI